MHKKSPLLTAIVAAVTLTTGLLLASESPKEVTVNGEGMCAKCERGETSQCQTAIEVTEGGKSVVYYVAKNAVSDAFHKNVCMGTAKVTATGTVEMKEGKHVLTASKIEVVK